MYLDADAAIRFKRLDTIGCIPIFEDTIEGDLLYFIRYYDNYDIMTGNTTTVVEVYSRRSIDTYEYSLSGLIPLGSEEHHWGLVPINIFYNNKEELGDYETVLSEIDAYDKLESDNLNEVEYFNDAYLALYGVEGTRAEDIAAMKENRVLLLPTDAKAEWLIKSINDTYLENLKTRLDKNIHKFSYCPPMTDEDFSQNASGVAMKYKLMGLENATAKKEAAFKMGLQRRLELICNMLALQGASYDYRAIDIIFTRNIPNNIVELADVVNKIGHLYSEETQMSILPIEVDYEAEQEKKQ
jgi:SPP1 family phage portal protein